MRYLNWFGCYWGVDSWGLTKVSVLGGMLGLNGDKGWIRGGTILLLLLFESFRLEMKLFFSSSIAMFFALLLAYVLSYL